MEMMPALGVSIALRCNVMAPLCSVSPLPHFISKSRVKSAVWPREEKKKKKKKKKGGVGLPQYHIALDDG